MALATETKHCLCTVPSVPAAVPRATFDINICDGSVAFVGKSETHNVNAAQVAAIYELPQPKAFQSAAPLPSRILIALSCSIKVQRSQISQLLLQPKVTKESAFNLSAPVPARFQEKEKLDSITAEDALLHLLPLALERPLERPSASDFSNSEAGSSVKCHVKASEGLLFPLQNCIIFVNKPILVIQCSSVVEVSFNASPRFLDMEVHYSGEDGEEKMVVFSTIDRSEQAALEEYVRKNSLGKGNGLAVPPPVTSVQQAVLNDIAASRKGKTQEPQAGTFASIALPTSSSSSSSRRVEAAVDEQNESDDSDWVCDGKESEDDSSWSDLDEEDDIDIPEDPDLEISEPVTKVRRRGGS